MESSITDAFKTATEKLHDRVAALGDQATYQVRKNVPRAQRALNAGYDEASDALRSLAGNRTAQLWIAAGAVGLFAGLFLLRSRSDR
jgi:hypothetical protein